MNPLVCTWTSIPDHPGLARLLRSCQAWGWQTRVIEMPWHDLGHWESVFAEAERARSEDFTHFLRLDAWDTIMTGPPSELHAALGAYSQPAVLISAECAAWPGGHRQEHYPPSPYPWRYAHSPMTFDLTQLIPAAFRQIPDRGYGSDQRWFADCILDGMPGIAIDTYCQVVQSLGHCHPWEQFFEVVEIGTDSRDQNAKHRIRNKLLGTLPLCCHGNGRAAMDWLPQFC